MKSLPRVEFPHLRCNREYAIICGVNKKWTVEYTDEFEAWWLELSVATQDDIDRVVMLLEEHGPALGYPYSSDIRGGKYRLARAAHPEQRTSLPCAVCL